ncbi:hypothetical protein [Flavihumibacter solisilvae]|uniref:Uncharacterized protein n=1 Tax=Flavihumibacter solisilvae TaxID=1349421 RepID=A0A0C1LEQ6_9BACT|nr:hypothetical protein [Flavihumibacter solisilvae]KIC93878.1 hypothetical protein OI18_14925 [Flavihumibacter solisilvae]
MTELEELKAVLRVRLNEKRPEAPSVHQGLLRRSSGTITSLKRSLRFELIACVAFLVLTIISPLVLPAKGMVIYAAVVGSYCLLFLGYLSRLARKLNRLHREVPSTLRSLESIHSIIKEYTRLYFRLCMLSVPVFFGLAIATLGSWSSLKAEHFFIIAAWTIIIYIFSKWYLRYLYGNHLAELQKNINDLKIHD